MGGFPEARTAKGDRFVSIRGSIGQKSGVMGVLLWAIADRSIVDAFVCAASDLSVFQCMVRLGNEWTGGIEKSRDGKAGRGCWNGPMRP